MQHSEKNKNLKEDFIESRLQPQEKLASKMISVEEFDSQSTDTSGLQTSNGSHNFLLLAATGFTVPPANILVEILYVGAYTRSGVYLQPAALLSLQSGSLATEK